MPTRKRNRTYGSALCSVISLTRNKEGPRMSKQFKEFAMRGNVIDMAVGIA